jgi:hypothetical protein
VNSKGLNGPFWPCRPDVCKNTNYMKKAPRGGHLTTDPLWSGLHPDYSLYWTWLDWGWGWGWERPPAAAGGLSHPPLSSDVA